MSTPNSPVARARVILFGVMLQGLILLVGCGKPPEATGIPVSGTVTVSGTPLTSGSVHFSPDSSKGNTFTQDVTGKIKADGTYSLHFTNSQGKSVPGAPVGWYKVLVKLEKAMPGPDGKLPKGDEINPMYQDAKKSKLEVEVKENAPPGAYDLKLTK